MNISVYKFVEARMTTTQYTLGATCAEASRLPYKSSPVDVKTRVIDVFIECI